LEKLQIARSLLAETTMTLSWIAQRLKMGAPGSLANSLRTNPKMISWDYAGPTPFRFSNH